MLDQFAAAGTGWPVVLLVVAHVLLTLCLNTVRFVILAWLSRVRVSMAKALEITVLGSAVSVVPAGPGIRGGVAAAISPVVGLAAAFAFLSAFLIRLVGLVVIAPLAAILSLRTCRPENDEGRY